MSNGSVERNREGSAELLSDLLFDPSVLNADEVKEKSFGDIEYLSV